MTTYTVHEHRGGSEVVAETAFSLDVALVGGVLDATFIKFQRRRKLIAQFEWVDDHVGK